MNNDLHNGNDLNEENIPKDPKPIPTPNEETTAGNPGSADSSDGEIIFNKENAEALNEENKAAEPTPEPTSAEASYQAQTPPQYQPPQYPNWPQYQPPQYQGWPQIPPQYQHTYASYNPAPTPQSEEKKKKAQKSARGVSRAVLAVVCICTVLLSCASGFLGAYLATGRQTDETNLAGPDTSDPVVIYQSAAAPSEGMSTDSGSSSYYNVAQMVHASVVEITTEHLVNSFFQYVTQGAGSGIILSEDGYILTNNHVIADGGELARTITVRMTTGEEFEATVIGTDADSDIAVLKINATNLPAVIIGDSDKLAVGEEVIAVGNPLGELGGTVTNGIISALDREIDVDGTTMNLLQTNTAINPGNSGGGLFNMSGELIGVVNAKSSGTGIEGLGFAIPINDAINVAEQLIENGYVSGKPYLGVSFYNITSYSEALYYNLKHLGVYIIGLDEGLNDDVFKVGDRVIAVDGNEISSHDDIKAILKTHEVGDTIVFTIYRNGKMREVEAACYELLPESSSVEFEV